MERFRNLADFVRKAQMANYEAFRAMYEGRNAQLFHPTTAVITWMSNPAQPSFVWQLYHYDLEPMSSYFAVMHASELVHIQFNEANGQVQVINNKPEPVTDAVARVAVYDLDGKLAYEHETKLTAAPDAATNLVPVQGRPISWLIIPRCTFSSWSCTTPGEHCSRATSTGLGRPTTPPTNSPT